VLHGEHAGIKDVGSHHKCGLKTGNDEEDQCMGVGVVSTRPIGQGEQIFISYSGDEKIEDTWGDIFR
jgi:hypothetical protein